MPFDIGWTEIAVVVVVAIIFIGPKDLPRVLRTMGEWIAKAKSLTREFRGYVDEMIREAELDEVKREIESIGDADVGRYVENTIDPTGEIKDAFDFGGSEFDGTPTSRADVAPEPTPAEIPAEPETPAPAEPAPSEPAADGDGPKDQARGGE